MNLLATKGNRDFYINYKGQVIEFNFTFSPETVIPAVYNGRKNRPVATKTVEKTVRGTFLRNGRCFSDVVKARLFLQRYLYHNGLISLSEFRNYRGQK